MKQTTHKIEHQIFKQVANLLTSAPALFDIGEKGRATEPELELYDFHKPAMPAGNYELSISQTVYQGVNENGGRQGQFTKSQTFKIERPPYALTPPEIHNIFPPKGSFGDHSDTMPYIVLNRSTLPWEVGHHSNQNNIPWLALIVLDESEADLSLAGQSNIKIKIPASLIPDTTELEYLASVMQKKGEVDKALLVANRLPKPQSTSIVHVIALDTKAKNNQYTSLFSWSFSCSSAKENLMGILKDLNRSLFRLPNSQSSTLNNRLKQGFVPLPHLARNGQRIMSWYRSPLIPQNETSDLNISHVNQSDQLLQYFNDTKRLNTTYASAWELGKWLTLRQKEVAKAIYNWKRGIIVKEKSNQSTDIENEKVKQIGATINSIFNKNASNAPLPQIVEDWLVNLILLRPIPFSNLVPHKDLLPEESIRFFNLDEGWIWALIDGAISVGRLATDDGKIGFQPQQFNFSGCLIRSKVITGYPDLQITSNNNLPFERRKIGNSISFCLFYNEANNQPISQLELFLKPQGMFFGPNLIDETYQKTLHQKDTKAPKIHIDNVLQNENLRLIDVKNIGQKAKGSTSFKSSAFTFSMLKGSPKVIIKNNKAI
jgi:hypothetical protein